MRTLNLGTAVPAGSLAITPTGDGSPSPQTALGGPVRPFVRRLATYLAAVALVAAVGFVAADPSHPEPKGDLLERIQDHSATRRNTELPRP